VHLGQKRPKNLIEIGSKNSLDGRKLMIYSNSERKIDYTLHHPSLLPGTQAWTETVLLKSGKKLRPRLALQMGEALGVSNALIAPYARIAELVHSATLAHDDVIDQATERRNAPTLNYKLTQARAVLSGDLLLARAMVELSELGSLVLVKRMAQVLEDLVSGEWLQLENRGNLGVEIKALDEIAKLKTASLLGWCTELPMHLKSVEPEQVEYARKFGEHLGLAFQYGDDCLDFSVDSGKDFAKDLKEGLLNQVTYLLLEKEPKLKPVFASLYPNPASFSEEDFLRLVRESLLKSAIDEVWKKARMHGEIAKSFLVLLLKQHGSSQSFQPLLNTVDLVLQRGR
jgi:geranylgeranyl pyrophosphate synthase